VRNDGPRSLNPHDRTTHNRAKRRLGARVEVAFPPARREVGPRLQPTKLLISTWQTSNQIDMAIAVRYRQCICTAHMDDSNIGLERSVLLDSVEMVEYGATIFRSVQEFDLQAVSSQLGVEDRRKRVTTRTESHCDAIADHKQTQVVFHGYRNAQRTT
jgi:hypothetical protein